MANRKYRDLMEFRALLIRLTEEERKLTPVIVESMYDQLFNQSIIQCYADKEINEVYFYLSGIKTGYSINDLKGLLNYFRKLDTMTFSLLNYVDQGNNKVKIEQIEKKVQDQLENITNAPLSVLETLHHVIPSHEQECIRAQLSAQVLRSAKASDTIAGIKRIEDSNEPGPRDSQLHSKKGKISQKSNHS
jgi:hypothetical protein